MNGAGTRPTLAVFTRETSKTERNIRCKASCKTKKLVKRSFTTMGATVSGHGGTSRAVTFGGTAYRRSALRSLPAVLHHQIHRREALERLSQRTRGQEPAVAEAPHCIDDGDLEIAVEREVLQSEPDARPVEP